MFDLNLILKDLGQALTPALYMTAAIVGAFAIDRWFYRRARRRSRP